jgi:hypothetical protein
MPTENDFETALQKYPELIEEGLQVIGRQMVMYGRRMDLVFADKFKRTLITELKWGPIKDEHIGQIMAYEGMLLSSTDPSVRVMLVGTRVPPNLRMSLDHHGIAWKEITPVDLVGFLRSKSDDGLLKLFEGAAVVPLANVPRRVRDVTTSQAVASKPQSATTQNGTLLQEKLSTVVNPDARRFFEEALQRNHPTTDNALRYDDAKGAVRWYVIPRVFGAYVVQKGRFTSDEQFWKSHLSASHSVKPKQDGDADLRFHLVTNSDFRLFEETARREAAASTFDWEISRRRKRIPIA